jgi:hypothetical protein
MIKYTRLQSESAAEIMKQTCITTWLEERFLNTDSVLGGLVVSVLVIGTKARGFEPGESNRFLRAIEESSTPSVGGEVKPWAPYEVL